eukprot:TRINITY_DN1330_c1_g1_i1.p1 TRINITY_DN1330_c1_g1~~TRINITY_DN1330_c1_g1_i1.p1  ORF type:complete len:256 (+),score=24.94 TRINITY_DN1330_c1_g1_i1:88-855(+)
MCSDRREWSPSLDPNLADDKSFSFKGCVSRDGEKRFELTSHGCSLVIDQQEEEKRLGDENSLYTVIWESAQLLHMYFTDERHFKSEHFVGKRVLELGSGTGVVGIVLASLGANVTLTDLPQAIPLIEKNIALNFSEQSSLRPRAIALNWRDPVPSGLGPFDLVVCCDVLYCPNLYEALLNTLRQVMDHDTECLIASIERGFQHRFFEMLAAADFELEPVVDFDFARFTSSAIISEDARSDTYYLQWVRRSSTLSS